MERSSRLLCGQQCLAARASAACPRPHPVAAQAGFVGVLRSLAYLLLGLPAGAFIDRWDRKRTMILCDAGRALALASIPVAYALGDLTMLQIYLVSTIEG